MPAYPDTGAKPRAGAVCACARPGRGGPAGPQVFGDGGKLQSLDVKWAERCPGIPVRVVHAFCVPGRLRTFRFTVMADAGCVPMSFSRVWKRAAGFLPASPDDD